ncbi:hypothetical protein D083_2966 [Dickeya solani RNS 08.23.3.1.A]|nr:hypothetical protein D083_2966 [Dickeya solani RNS 08.23.3.1.A]
MKPVAVIMAFMQSETGFSGGRINEVVTEYQHKVAPCQGSEITRN